MLGKKEKESQSHGTRSHNSLQYGFYFKMLRRKQRVDLVCIHTYYVYALYIFIVYAQHQLISTRSLMAGNCLGTYH